jgi:hypothetical protein
MNRYLDEGFIPRSREGVPACLSRGPDGPHWVLLYLHVCIVHVFQDMSNDVYQYISFSNMHTFAYTFYRSSHSPYFSLFSTPSHCNRLYVLTSIPCYSRHLPSRISINHACMESEYDQILLYRLICRPLQPFLPLQYVI